MEARLVFPGETRRVLQQFLKLPDHRQDLCETCQIWADSIKCPKGIPTPYYRAAIFWETKVFAIGSGTLESHVILCGVIHWSAYQGVLTSVLFELALF